MSNSCQPLVLQDAIVNCMHDRSIQDVAWGATSTLTLPEGFPASSGTLTLAFSEGYATEGATSDFTSIRSTIEGVISYV